MWNPHAEVLIFLGFAIVLNAVIFGGITLGYFLDKHGEDRRRRRPRESTGPRAATGTTATRAGPAASPTPGRGISSARPQRRAHR
jgi:hypothetical protein